LLFFASDGFHGYPSPAALDNRQNVAVDKVDPGQFLKVRPIVLSMYGLVTDASYRLETPECDARFAFLQALSRKEFVMQNRRVS
jgi:hypothetical protein